MKTHVCKFVLLFSLVGMSGAASAISFQCGHYDYSAATGTTANVGTAATALFASPGGQYLLNSLVTAHEPWWLFDVYGTGALMGCQPAVSELGSYGGTRVNSYENGNLVSQQVSTSDGPVSLYYTYDTQNRVQTSEALCYSGAVNKEKVQMTWAYGGDTLQSVTINGPENCSIGPFPIQIIYSYGSQVRLPTQVVVAQGGNIVGQTDYAYTVATDGQLSQVSWSAFTTAYKLTYTRSGNVVDSYTSERDGANTITYQQAYRPNGQWLSSLQPNPSYPNLPGWGLRLTYDSQDRITTACNNTGFPGTSVCPAPMTFSYESKKKPK